MFKYIKDLVAFIFAWNKILNKKYVVFSSFLFMNKIAKAFFLNFFSID